MAKTTAQLNQEIKSLHSQLTTQTQERDAAEQRYHGVLQNAQSLEQKLHTMQQELLTMKARGFDMMTENIDLTNAVKQMQQLLTRIATIAGVDTSSGQFDLNDLVTRLETQFAP